MIITNKSDSHHINTIESVGISFNDMEFKWIENY